MAEGDKFGIWLADARGKREGESTLWQLTICTMLKSALEIDEDTKIQFHVHRDEKYRAAGSEKIFIWTPVLPALSELNFSEIHTNEQMLNEFFHFFSCKT